MKKSSIVYLGIFIIFALFLVAGFTFRQSEKTLLSDTPVSMPVTTTLDRTENWKTYENKELGFSLSYPGKWFTYDEALWKKDNQNKVCDNLVGVEAPKNMVIFSRENLGTCVGFDSPTPFEGWSGDLLVYVDKQGLPDFPYVLGKDGVQLVKIDGETASKYPFTEKSERPMKAATRIYVKHQGKSYIIEFNQTDDKGHYDPVFDQVLSNFHFVQ